ncbi:MAG: carboxy terminal-processing peptidase [Kiritimatiellae bacterium]|nr:carboxy terminal-processing peptidase [Kiritimatiellia bacterium]
MSKTLKIWSGLGLGLIVLVLAGLYRTALAQEAPAPAPTVAAEPKAPVAPKPEDVRAEREKFDRLGSRVSRILAAVIPRVHLFQQPVSDAIAAKAVDLYLDALDPDRIFFLRSDEEQFRRDSANLARDFRDGNLAFAWQVQDRFDARVRNRLEFVRQTLSQGFDLQSKEEYEWRRNKAMRAADEAAWDDLWRRKLQHEYVARMVSVKLAEDSGTKEEPAAATGSVRTPGAAELEREVIANGGAEGLEDRELTPEEFLAKRYRQYERLIGAPDSETIVAAFLSSFTMAYDPHSEYMSPMQTEDFDINMKLKLVGIGAVLTSEDGAAKIERIMPGGPAELDGRLQPGDRIIAVGQDDQTPEEILHLPLSRAVRKIRGSKGSRVTLVYWPAGDISGSTERRIELVRDEVKLEESAAKSKVVELPGADGQVRRMGLITLPEFYADFKPAGDSEARRCSTDVKRLLKELEGQNIDGIALDLRNNGGGSLQDAIDLAGFFIRSGPIVQVRSARQVEVHSDPDPEMLYAGPMVVLVNRMSASASEIVAAALQDYGRAIVIGDSKTHGKGSVQALLPLEVRGADLGSFKVTNASFYRINGQSTQVEGVKSDIVVSSVFDGMKIGEEYLENAMPWSVVDPAFYATLSDQAPPMDILRGQSEQRRNGDAAFQKREELLKRIRERTNANRISLNFEERLAMARADRELNEEQRKLMGATPANDESPTQDAVLMEALRVLSDICRWRDALRGSSPQEEVLAEAA